MKSTFDYIWSYLMDVVSASFMQIILLLGPIILLSFLMNFISKLNESLSYKVMGAKVYLYIFAWLGTAVHELGHAFFALIFGHKITDIQLFSAKGHGGSLGYVAHSYNKKNIYHNIGNFFIGIGPVLFGTFMLFLISLLMYNIKLYNLANIKIDQHFIQNFDIILKSVYSGFIAYLKLISSGENALWWKLLILIYLLYSIGSSITLSSSDIKSAASGFLYVILLIFLFNMLTVWINDFTNEIMHYAQKFLSGFYFLIILSILVNLCFIVVLYILSLFKR